MGRIVYKNKVELQGLVADNLIWGMAVNGKRYLSFSLITNNDGKYISETETNSKEFIRIMVFNNRWKRLVDKLKEVKFRRGLYIGLEGRLQTSKTEFKGQDLIQLSVFVNRLWIIDKDGNETMIE